MKRLIAALALACFSLPTFASGPQVNIYFFFDSAAQTSIASSRYSSTANYITAQINSLNAANAAAGISGTFVSAGSSTTCCGGQTKIQRTTTSPGALIWLSHNDAALKARDAGGADLVVGVTEYSDPLDGQQLRDGGVRNWPDGVAVVKASSHDYQSAVHLIAEMFGSKHQTSGGSDDDTSTGTTHAWWRKTGVSPMTCMVEISLGGGNIDPTIITNCMGWDEYFYSSPPPHVCDAQTYCDDWVKFDAPAYYPPATAAASHGLLTTGSGPSNPYNCSAIDTGYSPSSVPPYVRPGGGPMGAATSGAGTAFNCMNVYNLSRWSDNTTLYNGSVFGNPQADTASTVAANFAAVATFHNGRSFQRWSDLKARVGRLFESMF